MLSFLTNRHYHLLTKELPEQMRADQPKVVYLPSHNSEKVHYHRTNNPSSKLKLRRSKQQPPEVNNCIGDCCPTCFSSDNISVEFYGRKHVCVKCRKLIRDEYGNQTRIFVNQMGDIVCLGIKKIKRAESNHKKMYYYTDYTNLHINGRSAFATFAKPDEMVIILRLPSPSVE